MKASIIISTYNGAKKIPYLLNALLEQTFRDFEVIIIIDGSTDNTVETIETYLNRFESIRFFYQENSGRSKVRNRGVQEARGELIIFYDDDMVPACESVEKHIDIHRNHKDILLAGNPIEYVEPQKTEIQNYKAALVKQWTRKYEERLTSMNESNLFFTAANCSIPKTVFKQLNGFDERLTDAEDYNLGWRALKMGIQVLFDKDNEAIHREFITAKGYLLRLRQYRHAHKNLMIFYPEVKNMQTNGSSFLKHAVYRVFAFPVWIKSIDKERLKFLPTAFRYKIYSMVFHALSVEYPDVKI